MPPDTVRGSEPAPSGPLRQRETREVALSGSDGAGRTWTDAAGNTFVMHPSYCPRHDREDCDGCAEERELATYDLAVRYDRSCELLDSWLHHDEDAYCAAILRRPTRLFATGDVLFSSFTNGQAERWAFSGWSSKRRAPIRDFYVQFGRWQWPEDEARGRQFTNRTPLALVTRPAALRKHSWRQPGLRRFALSALRAACPAFPVSTNSGSSPRVIEFRALVARWMTARRLAEDHPRPMFVHQYCTVDMAAHGMRSNQQTSTTPFRCRLCRLEAHQTTIGELSQDEESWWVDCADAIWHEMTPEERDEVDHL